MAVIGLGVIGLSVVAYARAFGFRTVAIDPVAQRREIAGKIGADLCADPGETDCVERVRAFCDGHGADTIVECTSVWPAIELGMHIAADEATLVVAARHTDVPAFNPVGHPHLGKKLSLLTSYGHQPAGQRWDRDRSRALTLVLLSRDRLNVGPILTNRFRWDQLPEVYHQLDQGETDLVGIVFEWE